MRKELTKTLTGLDLDWACAVAVGLNPKYAPWDHARRGSSAYDMSAEVDGKPPILNCDDLLVWETYYGRLVGLGRYYGYSDGPCLRSPYSPTTKPSQMYDLLVEAEISLEQKTHPPSIEAYIWDGDTYRHQAFGETPTLAILRCFVLSRLGAEVEFPFAKEPPDDL